MKTNELKLGTEEGEVCWRAGCRGVIALQPIVNCSCHISAPCSACTSVKFHCPECEWVAPDLEINGFEIMKGATENAAWKSWTSRALDPRRIDYHIDCHTNASQLCHGVYPEGTTRAEVEVQCKGTFGGQFEQFGGGKFRYVAYTD